MKLKPTLLFLGTTIFILLLGLLKRSQSIDIQLHDIYFVFGYLQFAIIVSLVTGLTALIYYILERFKRPIKSKIGFWHFGLFIIGSFLVSVAVLNLPRPSAYYDFSNIYRSIAMIRIGSIILLASVVIFLYGFTQALMRK